MSDHLPHDQPGGDGGAPAPPRQPRGWSLLKILVVIFLGIPLVLAVLALLVLGACMLSMG